MSENNFAQPSENITALLSEISANTKRQAEYSRRQLIVSYLILAAVILLLVAAIVSAIILVPKATAMMDSIVAVSEQLGQVDFESINQMAEEIRSITATLAPTLENIGTAFDDAQTNLTSAFDKLNTIDFEKLNDAISDLSAVVAPLARIFGK